MKHIRKSTIQIKERIVKHSKPTGHTMNMSSIQKDHHTKVHISWYPDAYQNLSIGIGTSKRIPIYWHFAGYRAKNVVATRQTIGLEPVDIRYSDSIQAWLKLCNITCFLASLWLLASLQLLASELLLKSSEAGNKLSVISLKGREDIVSVDGLKPYLGGLVVPAHLHPQRPLIYHGLCWGGGGTVEDTH